MLTRSSFHVCRNILALCLLFALTLSPTGCSKNAETATKAPPKVPVIESLDPASVALNWKGTIKVNGQHFTKDCTMLYFRGTAKTRFVSDTLLEVDVGTSTTDQAGDQRVKAHDLANGNTSNEATFTVQAAAPKR